jgi:hypothetical protein
MPRTEEDIASGVDITIMRNATLSTYPASYSEVWSGSLNSESSSGNTGNNLLVDAQYSTSGGRCWWIHCSTEGRRHW